MRLLHRSETGEISLTKDLVGDDPIPPYAILSHTWGLDDEEVTFEDLTNGTNEKKPGYEKIRFCEEQARQDGLQHFWIDTCCINKRNYAELSHAIGSMFRWYCKATRCYVYLSDVPLKKRRRDESSKDTWDLDFRESRWFTRGWTLQELLAPASVEFFSRNCKRLGDKSSLQQQIYEITGVPKSALHGDPLSQFSVNERMSWINPRQTKLEEDKAYSLLGIFGVYIPPRYGEGMTSAFKRLEEEIDKLEKCTRDFRLTDPRDDKKRIEDTKGGLLKDSYRWIIENSDYQQWCGNPQSRLLWIKGDPGKGKTMLLCGITNELKKSIAKSDLLSYFFCQATDSRINNAIAVLRGLIYLLVNQQPLLISHVRKKYDHAGKALFEDANAWFALSEIFNNILQDPSLESTYLIVDALDECVVDLPKLLDFIVQTSSESACIKWIVSSRNWPSIEKDLDTVTQKVRLCLELHEKSVSAAIVTYIQFKVDWLAKRNRYNNDTRNAVQRYLSLNANDTFLWVALVCQQLSNISGWKAQQKLTAFPPGLDALYRRMIEQITNSDDAELCKHILAVVSVVYRPVTLEELVSFVDISDDVSDEYEALTEIIELCGSFLTLRERAISFIHQSAKEYLLAKASNEIFPSGKGETHHEIFSRSLEVMSRTLRRDIYGLGALGYPIERVKQLDPDPLVASRYSCSYWVDHLYDWNSDSCANHGYDIQDNDAVENFVRKKYLYWLEALSLCRSMSEGVVSMSKLEALFQVRADVSELLELVQDARRFIMYHKLAIESNPLQTYASALLFSPARSLIRSLFRHEEPKWINIQPAITDEWSPCFQTLEGHSGTVNSVAFARDSTWLASGSGDNTVKIWDASSGKCLQTLAHSGTVTSVAFSRDLMRLASGSYDRTIKIWDASSGECLHTLAHSGLVISVAFSHDSNRLASASYGDGTVKIWDASSGKCLQTLKGHRNMVNSVTFSCDSTRLASSSDDNTVKIWDASSGKCLQTLEGHMNWVKSVVFSSDSTRLASASRDGTVKIWDASSGKCLQTLKGHKDWVKSVVFSFDSTQLASGSDDRTVRIWDASNGDCLLTLEGHSHSVASVTFSSDSARLASASVDGTVKIWDASSEKYLQTLEGHSDWVNSVAFSLDSTRLASASGDSTVKIWDTSSGQCLRTLEGHSGSVIWVVFSRDSTQLASASRDGTAKIWDTSNGECLQTLEGPRDWVWLVALSSDSAQLASTWHHSIKIWDTSSGKCLQTLNGHGGSVISVAFSPDSSRLASGSGDRTIKIWDASSGDCLQTLEGHSHSVTSVAFSRDLMRLASGSYDMTIKIWDVSNGACLQTLPAGRTLRNISFDDTSLRLHTEIGTIAINVSSVELTTAIVRESPGPRHQGGGLSSDGAWITYNYKNLVRLPSEYRPSWSAVSAKAIGVGVGSGKVWMCSFNAENS